MGVRNAIPAMTHTAEMGSGMTAFAKNKSRITTTTSPRYGSVATAYSNSARRCIRSS